MGTAAKFGSLHIAALTAGACPDEVDPPSLVTRELDPRVHLLGMTDCRVKPGNDVG
jgi:hypothetical protein